MTARSPSAFALSALLHASVAVAVLLGIFFSQRPASERPVIFELVAGEGNNYGATEAPALGSANGTIKITVPKMEIKPVSLAHTPPVAEPVPAQVEPVPATNPAKPVKRLDDYKIKKTARQIVTEIKRITKMTKAAFDQQYGKSAPPKSASVSPRATNVPRIDAEGIAKGVVGGSTANKTGGASGKALTREEHSLLDSYKAFVRQQLKAAFDAVKPTGLSDQLETDVELHILADGTLAHARIVKSSGSDEFDHAALEAVMRVEPLGARPEGLPEIQIIPFRMTEPDNTN
jgi:colicin import membrane protein